MRNALVFVGIGALVLAGGWWYMNRIDVSARNENAGAFENREVDRPAQEAQPPSASIGEENLVELHCADGKSITAVFARDIIGLTLSDGRQMELRQDPEDSARYFTVGGAIEFRVIGEDGAVLVEGGRTTHANCVAGV